MSSNAILREVNNSMVSESQRLVAVTGDSESSLQSRLKAGVRRADLLKQAREIADIAWNCREQTDRDRRLPDEVIARLRASGLMKLCRHRRWGGAEADPMTFLDVGRELARGSGSLGWVFSVLGFHEWYMSFVSEELQAEVWANEPDAMICDSYATVGKIERAAGGYSLEGTWRFCSGIEWSSWIAVGGYTVAPDGEQPEHLMFFVPKSDLTVIDDWHTLGLRGTASRAVDIPRTFVPDHRVFALGRLMNAKDRGPVAEDGPLWRMPLSTMQGLAILTPSTGLAQRAVEEYHGWTKARVRPYENNAPAREAPAPQLTLAKNATQWDASWALAQKYAQFGWDRAINGEPWVLTEEERAQLFSWRGYIGRSCVELTDEMFSSSGAMVLFEGNALQQVFRDVHATGTHIGVDRNDAYTGRGRVAMGFSGHAFH